MRAPGEPSSPRRLPAGLLRTKSGQQTSEICCYSPICAHEEGVIPRESLGVSLLLVRSAPMSPIRVTWGRGTDGATVAEGTTGFGAAQRASGGREPRIRRHHDHHHERLHDSQHAGDGHAPQRLACSERHHCGQHRGGMHVNVEQPRRRPRWRKSSLEREQQHVGCRVHQGGVDKHQCFDIGRDLVDLLSGSTVGSSDPVGRRWGCVSRRDGDRGSHGRTPIQFHRDFISGKPDLHGVLPHRLATQWAVHGHRAEQRNLVHLHSTSDKRLRHRQRLVCLVSSHTTTTRPRYADSHGCRLLRGHHLHGDSRLRSCPHILHRHRDGAWK